MVAQDTAFWDLKEKLHQLENNHEKLQQNMVDVQMQHETLSSQYQDELRLRPETLNRLSSTREICDVLEVYGEKLKDTLSRCKADQAILCDAYHQSGQIVKELRIKQLEAENQSKQTIDNLQEKIKLTTEHQAQLVQYFTSAKTQADTELNHIRNELQTTLLKNTELSAELKNVLNNLEHYKSELEKKEESLKTLQSDTKQMMYDFNLQKSDMQKKMYNLEKEVKESSEANDSLKRALSHQEAFTKSVCDQNNNLMEKISILEEDKNNMTRTLAGFEQKLKEAMISNSNLEKEIIMLMEQKEIFQKDIQNEHLIIENAKTEIANLQNEIVSLEKSKMDTITELDQAVQESNVKSAKIEELICANRELDRKIHDMENLVKNITDTNNAKIKELTTVVANKEKELDSNAATINQLMSDIKSGTDICSKLEVTVQKLKKEVEIEKENGREVERNLKIQIEQLDHIVRDKDDELSKQMSIILEMRNEKERLEDKIESMQKTIDNIQKELTGRVAPRCFDRAEQDHDSGDNAVMLTPGPPKAMQTTSPTLQKKSEWSVRRSEPKKLDSLLFNILSDSSVDGDVNDVSLNTNEVNRRFDALVRGERVSPMPPFSALKRCAAVSTRLAYSRESDPISLSQIKNELKNKEKTFFKNKRLDKGRKLK